MASRIEVYRALDSERDYQYQRWGSPYERTPSEFLIYMQDYLTQAIHQATREPDTPGLKVSLATMDTIRKVTALGVSCMEQHGALIRNVG